MTARIQAVHAASRQTYGAPRVHAGLRAQGVVCSPNRVARLMRAAGIAGCHRRRWTVTAHAAEGENTVLIAMAGLPGSGKSRLARALARQLPATVLDKDQVRAALFSAADIEYSTAQDDFCLSLMLQVADYLLRRDPGRVIILDGRPFVRRYQRQEVARFAAEHALPVWFVECVCSEATARRRLTGGGAAAHLARNRDFTLYERLKSQAESIEEPKLLADTDQPFPRLLRRTLAALQARRTQSTAPAASSVPTGTP